MKYLEPLMGCEMKHSSIVKDNLSPEELKEIPLVQLTELLDSDTSYRANYEFAQRVVKNDDKTVNYYIGVLSLPIISYIERKIIYRDILTEFYEFLCKPINIELKKPEWHKVALYRGETCRLDSYTSLITTRHFCRVAQKEKDRAQSNCEMMDRVDYEALLNCANEEDTEYPIGSKLWKAHAAFHKLCERDQQVLLRLIIEKMTALEAWQLLAPYIKPRAVNGLTSEEVKLSWSDKQKQNALSLIKVSIRFCAYLWG